MIKFKIVWKKLSIALNSIFSASIHLLYQCISDRLAIRISWMVQVQLRQGELGSLVGILLKPEGWSQW
jgi:hypothetical protein